MSFLFTLSVSCFLTLNLNNTGLTVVSWGEENKQRKADKTSKLNTRVV